MGTTPLDRELDPVIEVYKNDIDISLLRENLRRTVEERVRNLVALQAFAVALREAGLRARNERRDA
jgi:hypothetical protein